MNKSAKLIVLSVQCDQRETLNRRINEQVSKADCSVSSMRPKGDIESEDK
ncbi:hypothetical protein [Lactococcus lactis]|nr:hypothetical protein [Lactococcus lactis]